jgi:large subunit ribosomal protein L10
MENPRADKVAVVNEVRHRLDGATGSVITEYRGLTVGQLAELRQRLTAAGGDYKVYKNTLVKLAISSSPHELLSEYMTGPTAIAFVHGDVSAVAKALRDFARNNPALVIKGGLLDGASLSASELTSLADLPSRDVLLARLAGAIAAPLQTFAGLLQALPRNLAYGLSALLEQQGGVPEAAPPAVEAPAVAAEPSGESVPEAAEVVAEPAAPEPTDEAEAAPIEEATAEAAPIEEATAEAAPIEEAKSEDAAEEDAPTDPESTDSES